MIVVIMAGGLGKRMESDLPKVLHKVYGIIDQKLVSNEFKFKNKMIGYDSCLKPMIIHVIDTSLKLNPKKIFIVVGAYKDIIEQTINEYIGPNDLIEYIIQEQALGTGHAVMCCLTRLQSYRNTKTLILSGDVPLISENTIKNLLNEPNKFLITKLKNPFGCGRIILQNDKVIKIIEEKDCSSEEKNIQLVNCGIYQINSDILLKLIPQITNNNKACEYYLTDIVELMVKNFIEISYYELNEYAQYEIKNVNTKADLESLNNFLLDLR